MVGFCIRSYRGNSDSRWQTRSANAGKEQGRDSREATDKLIFGGPKELNGGPILKAPEIDTSASLHRGGRPVDELRTSHARVKWRIAMWPTVGTAMTGARRRILLLSLSALILRLTQGDAQQQPFRVDVNLVNLYVAVTDSAGRPIEGLGKDNFRVWEDNAQQEIKFFSSEDVPFTIGLILDRSGSMAPVIDDVYQAALHTIEASKEGDEAFVILFDDRIELLQNFTSDQKTLRQAARKVSARGRTALYDAVYTGLRISRKQRTARKRCLL